MLLEVCSADEAALVNALNGAGLSAFAAARAKRIINGRKVVYNLYCAVWTYLFALHTADTAV